MDIGQMKNYIPSHLLFQWHITERCNLRCTHCYQESYNTKELSWNNLLKILHQYIELLRCWREIANSEITGHINVTGGEPFLRGDFFELLDVFHKNQQLFTFAILSNGHLINEQIAQEVQKYHPKFVQVSLEGKRETHNKIRGKNSFDRTIKALKIMKKARIPTMISFTAHRANFREFPYVAEVGRQQKAFRVWADRLIPWGAGSTLTETSLSPEEVQEFCKIMKKEQKKQFRVIDNSPVSMLRALQFWEAGTIPYHCTAGDSLLAVLANGDLVPCRRMPIKIGNLLENSLEELYNTNPLLRDLRNRAKISKGCENCYAAQACRGGLKCLSYATKGDPFIADPGCWLSQRKTRNRSH
ncbi:MAG: radical SAM protein [Candidatus Hodarchaeales archaeon]